MHKSYERLQSSQAGDKSGQEGDFVLWNATDGVFADPNTYSTRAEAEAAVKAFRERFAIQGYYLTSGGLRIPPADVEIEILLIGTKD